jgi:hypothetical protein
MTSYIASLLYFSVSTSFRQPSLATLFILSQLMVWNHFHLEWRPQQRRSEARYYRRDGFGAPVWALLAVGPGLQIGNRPLHTGFDGSCDLEWEKLQTDPRWARRPTTRRRVDHTISTAKIIIENDDPSISASLYTHRMRKKKRRRFLARRDFRKIAAHPPHVQ